MKKTTTSSADVKVLTAREARTPAKSRKTTEKMVQTALTLKDDPQHQWRHDNFGRLLLVAFSDWDSRLLARLRASGFSNLKLVHLTCMRYLDFEGTRIAELAKRAGMTKAGMGQLVSQCERLSFVKVNADKLDARAKLVQFTKLGWSIIESNRRAIEMTEAEIRERLGVRVFDQVYQGLKKLRDEIEPLSRRLPSAPATTKKRKLP
jgi:DNA-binding MarR family transcriptional regulator